MDKQDLDLDSSVHWVRVCLRKHIRRICLSLCGVCGMSVVVLSSALAGFQQTLHTSHKQQHTHTHTEALTDAAPQMAQMQIARLKVRLRLNADGVGDDDEQQWDEDAEQQEEVY